MTGPAAEKPALATILLVEDDALVRAATALLLRDAGYAVIEAADGYEALAALSREAPINLLFTDIEMPGLSGLQLAERARGKRPALLTLLTSGGGFAPEPNVPFIAKPYRGSDLIKKLRAMFDKRTSS